MKKVLILSLTILLFLSGCNFFRSNPLPTSLEGVLTEQSATNDLKGTHLLTSDSGELTSLNSISLNLSAPEYLDNKVKVTGVMNEDTGIFEVKGIAVLERLSKVSGQGKLVPYENEELGFKTKYYDNWELEENNSGAGIEEKAPYVKFLSSSSEIIISQFPFNYVPTSYEDGIIDTPLQAYAGRNNSDYATVKTDISKQVRKIGPDMMDALELPNDCRGTDYYVYRSGFIYKISYQISGTCKIDSSGDDDGLKVFDQIVSDFQFIKIGDEDSGDFDVSGEDDAVTRELPPIDIELAEFESTSFGFKALYPKKWYYEGKNTLEQGILYHYGFSDKPMDEGGVELIGLDLMSGEMPKGLSLISYGIDGVIGQPGGVDDVTIYVQGVNRIYRLEGTSEYENLMLHMAKGVKKLEE
ncbi:MAG: hypothetical protein WC269_04185 [Candidatus Gracilibacteria bacterium]|jgi:hypothetical protein